MFFRGKVLWNVFYQACMMHASADRHGGGKAPSLSRRGLLKLGLGACAAAHAAFPRPSFAVPPGEEERSLSFFNTHTGKSLVASYWSAGKYVPGAMGEINHILRDHRTGEVKSIETRLLELLYVLRRKLETAEPYHIISGYRCSATNALLAENGRGVVKNSLHLRGWAADVRIPGRSLAQLRQAALKLQGGGVGYYPASDFIHIDVGRVRSW
jgi:uncharacterized protein YcbK (DUF882 family)